MVPPEVSGGVYFYLRGVHSNAKYSLESTYYMAFPVEKDHYSNFHLVNTHLFCLPSKIFMGPLMRGPDVACPF